MEEKMKAKTVSYAVLFFMAVICVGLYAGGPIDCTLQHCGSGCPYGYCTDASSCSVCTIDWCFNDEKGIREAKNCSTGPI
jgi:hypothetical protein